MIHANQYTYANEGTVEELLEEGQETYCSMCFKSPAACKCGGELADMATGKLLNGEPRIKTPPEHKTIPIDLGKVKKGKHWDD